MQEIGTARITTLAYPLWLIAFLGINICLLYYCFQDQALWKTWVNIIILQMPQTYPFIESHFHIVKAFPFVQFDAVVLIYIFKPSFDYVLFIFPKFPIELHS